MSQAALTQDEINALLGNIDNDPPAENEAEGLSPEEKDALGEIGNICMGTAATTLFTLLNNKVSITTPRVELLSPEEFRTYFQEGSVATSIKYTVGVEGTNLMVLNDRDVKIITDLMMGGSGVPSEEPINELHLSAISEVMNQMIGSASTALSQMLKKLIDISPPKSAQIDTSTDWLSKIDVDVEPVAVICFRMEIEDILDSKIIQVVPMPFAKTLISAIMDNSLTATPEETPVNQKNAQSQKNTIESTTSVSQNNEVNTIQSTRGYSQPTGTPVVRNATVNTPVFENFDSRPKMYPKENIDILMDVPLEVSVELGRVNKKIKDILAFTPGTIVELNRLVGEPVDILVNNRFIAKGEVVVIDENFGVRVTDIISPENRI